MKNKPALEIDRRTNFRASSEKLNFSKPLEGVRPDLEDNPSTELMDELVRKANCSVLGLPSAESEESIPFNAASRVPNMKILESETSGDRLVSIKKVVLAVDATKHSEATTHYAALIANWFNASLCIALVFPPASQSECGPEGAYNLIDRPRLELRARLDQLNEEAQQIVPECESVCLEGEPAEQISALARDLDADLIIITGHHPSFLARLLNLDKEPKIIRRAHCPVLVYQRMRVN